MIPRIRLPDGRQVPAIGQGTWHMGERADRRLAEIAALRLGLDLGMALIDTAEMYGEGGAEQVVGEAIAGHRDDIFLVSKVYPHNGTRIGVPAACERSLRRLRVERIDLYLLHWRGRVPLAETVEALQRLQEKGMIGGWGVSNFDTDDLGELRQVADGGGCVTNQVLYHPDARGIEWDVLPACRTLEMPVMAYSPLGQGGRLLRSRGLATVAARHEATAAQVAIAWALRGGGVIAIPKAVDPAHVRANAAASGMVLSAADLAVIDAAHPPPSRKRPLEML